MAAALQSKMRLNPVTTEIPANVLPQDRDSAGFRNKRKFVSSN
jgi:hypothetical protein